MDQVQLCPEGSAYQDSTTRLAVSPLVSDIGKTTLKKEMFNDIAMY